MNVDLERVVRLLMRREALGLLAAPVVSSISRQGRTSRDSERRPEKRNSDFV
jgi:hypothetical protein